MMNCIWYSVSFAFSQDSVYPRSKICLDGKNHAFVLIHKARDKFNNREQQKPKESFEKVSSTQMVKMLNNEHLCYQPGSLENKKG